HIGMGAGDIGSLNPFQENLAQDDSVVREVYEKLVEYSHPGTPSREVVPALAESWEVSSDGTLYTFHIRKGVQFHKGYGELTAEDVAFSFRIVLDPDWSAYTGQAFANNILKTEIVDDYTIKFYLKKPDPLFLASLPFPDSGREIISKKAAEELGPDAMRINAVGTGPFAFEEYVPMGHITLVRHDDYWAGKPILEKIVYHYMPSQAARDIAFVKGDIDLIKGPLEGSWYQQMKERGMIVDSLGPGFSSLLMFNLTKPPLDNWKVRAAIAYGINREEVSEVMGGLGYAPPQPSPIPEDYLFGTYDVPRYPYAPELAKELLAEAGYPNGLTLTKHVSERAYYLQQMEALQAQLKKVGINLELIVVDHTTFHARQFDDLESLILFGRIDWLAGPVLDDHFGSGAIVTKPGGGRNFSHYGDVVGSIDYLLEQAEGKPLEEQKEIFEECQRKLLADLAVYPLAEVKGAFGRREWVDLGYEPMSCANGGMYVITKDTKLLKH
ncbi:hypothetical protein KAR91_50465, partial [Candidatus Pacearchaeota archaeon]|nr:hypothetical protein [Candidatus Pacearchaeota archaeon]